MLKFHPNYRFTTASNADDRCIQKNRHVQSLLSQMNKQNTNANGSRTNKECFFHYFSFQVTILFFVQQEFVSYRLLFGVFIICSISDTLANCTKIHWLHVSDWALFVDCFIASQRFDSYIYAYLNKEYWESKRERGRKKINYRVQPHEILLMRILYSLCAWAAVTVRLKSLSALGVRWQCDIEKLEITRLFKC